MKFSIEQEKLITPLQLVSGAVERRQTLPVLSNVLLSIDGNVLSMTATDLEVEISAKVDLDGDIREGEITVPARKFVDIVKSFSSDSLVNIELVDSKLLISGGKSKFSLSTIASQEFPNVEESGEVLQFSLSALALKLLLERTQFAMAQQDVRYYLNGMLLEVNEDKLVSVSTDGHRLALSRLQLDGVNQSEVIQSIVPRKGILELAKLLGTNPEETVELTFGSNHLRAKIGDYLFTTKLVDGRFPDYDKVLPRNGDKTVIADKDVLRNALSRAAILCNEKFRGVRIVLEANNFAIFANNPEQEEAEVSVDVDYGGSELEIGFNVTYLLDVLNTIKTEKIKMTLGDSNSSSLVEEFEGSDSVYVVMPMRL